MSQASSHILILAWLCPVGAYLDLSRIFFKYSTLGRGKSNPCINYLYTDIPENMSVSI
jgi:hypothetical protein